MTKPLLPRHTRPAATVSDLAARRELKKGITLDDAAVARAAGSARLDNEPLRHINYNASNIELSFRAMTRALIDARKRGDIKSFGATLGTLEERTEAEPYWERASSATIGSVDYSLTMYSMFRRPAAGERDLTYPEREAGECVARFEGEDEVRRYVFADKIDGVPQIDDPRCWWVLSTEPDGSTKARPFGEWLKTHHPRHKRLLAKEAEVSQLAEPRGWSVGDHRRAVDGRHLEVVGDEVEPKVPGRPADDRIVRKAVVIDDETLG